MKKLEIFTLVALGFLAWWLYRRAMAAAKVGNANLEKVGQIQAAGTVGTTVLSLLA
jgi:hypothetical protein